MPTNHFVLTGDSIGWYALIPGVRFNYGVYPRGGAHNLAAHLNGRKQGCVMSKTTKTRARQSARTWSFEIFTYPQRSLGVRLLGLAWRWRIELLLVATVLVLGWWALDQVLSGWGWDEADLSIIGHESTQLAAGCRCGICTGGI